MDDRGQADRRARVLVVEDKASMRAMLVETLVAEGFEAEGSESGEDAVGRLRSARHDLVITDLQLPGISGLDVLRAARESDPFLPVILLTAFGTIEAAVRAMKEGAYDFLTKPVDTERLLLVAQRALEKRRMATDNLVLREELRERLEPPVIVGEAPSLLAALATARKAAATDATVLLLGESGTGKELVARAIHHESPRAASPLVVVNCAAIPRDLLENELFGSEKGAFTGAERRKIGRIELANRGTIFLDEVGDLSTELQAKILRVLQEREFERVGGTKAISVDVRIVAATNKNLREEVRDGAFREDLFYRLNVIPIELPPLRQRPGDVPLLGRWFVSQLARELGKSGAFLADAAIERLSRHSWPGNIRELRNTIERALILSDGPEIGPAEIALPDEPARDVGEEIAALAAAGAAAAGATVPLADAKREAMRRLEQDTIRRVLAETKGNKAEAARRLRLSYKSLWTKVKEYGLD
jgi:DNA-binding NtrC family response regulator